MLSYKIDFSFVRVSRGLSNPVTFVLFHTSGESWPSHNRLFGTVPVSLSRTREVHLIPGEVVCGYKSSVFIIIVLLHLQLVLGAAKLLFELLRGMGLIHKLKLFNFSRVVYASCT